MRSFVRARHVAAACLGAGLAFAPQLRAQPATPPPAPLLMGLDELEPGPFRSAGALPASTVSARSPAVPEAAKARVDLNTASAEELERLPGVGAATARRIVESREQDGPFGSVDELRRVKGLGAGAVDQLREFATTGAPVRGADEPAGTTAADARRILERYKAEPAIREVQEAAMRHAEVHPGLIRSWRTRARLSALAPSLRGEYRYVNTASQRLRTGGDTPDTRQQDLGEDHRPLGRVHWDLDRLVFNPDELRVSSEVTSLVRLRDSVLDQATKLYYERRRLQVELDLTPPKDAAGLVRKQLRLQELTASLDSLTGGFFSKELAARGLDPY